MRTITCERPNQHTHTHTCGRRLFGASKSTCSPLEIKTYSESTTKNGFLLCLLSCRSFFSLSCVKFILARRFHVYIILVYALCSMNFFALHETHTKCEQFLSDSIFSLWIFSAFDICIFLCNSSRIIVIRRPCGAVFVCNAFSMRAWYQPGHRHFDFLLR